MEWEYILINVSGKCRKNSGNRYSPLGNYYNGR